MASGVHGTSKHTSGGNLTHFVCLRRQLASCTSDEVRNMKSSINQV